VKKHHLIINLEDIKNYDISARQEISNKSFFYEAKTILLYGHYFKQSKEDIEKQVFTSNSNHHYDLVVVNNLLEYLPLEYLSIAIKDIFSYSSKHVMVILNFKSDLFKPIIQTIKQIPKT
jgi:translation initiation factor 2B subunit (eIF-2B alpha/beta/delta family)